MCQVMLVFGDFHDGWVSIWSHAGHCGEDLLQSARSGALEGLLLSN